VGSRRLEAKYDSRERRVVVDLDGALEPGPHRITVWAKLRDGQTISKSWLVSVSTDALMALPEASESQRRAMSAVNRFRAGLGLEPVRMDDRLNTASVYHSRYLARNGTTGHYEDSGKPGFTGSEPGDRHMAFGWVGSSWEAVAFGSTDENESIQNLIDAPYHRIPFMQPGELAFGSGYADHRLTTAFSMSSQRATLVYPADRQVRVPLRWAYRERPDPLRLHPGAKRPVGYPIMLVHFAPETETLEVRSAKLMDAQGSTVPTFLNTPQNDDELKNAVVLIPKLPLSPDSVYTASVEASTPGGDVLRTWSFRTAPASPISLGATAKRS
jgi:hypothetical protein